MNIETFNIRDFINGYGSSIDDERKGRRKETNEVFTPFEIVEHMCAMIDDKDWADPSKTFLEPTFGNGNIVCYIIWKRIAAGVPWMAALHTLYGIELMPDNVAECKDRVVRLLKELNVYGWNEKTIRMILDVNLVCSDFFEWDLENWRPINKESDTPTVSTANPLF